MINKERYKEICSDFQQVQEVKRAIRVNTLKITDEKLVKRLTKKKVKLEKVPFLEHGYYSSADFSLSSMPEYLQGLFYMQDAASQIPVQMLELKPEEKVLDMCACPGSKTTQMAMAMKNEGVIVALDTNLQRLKVLQNNLERMGVSNVVTYKKDARFADDLGMKFDKVLLDAPCSGNYTQGSEWLEKRKPVDFKEKAKVQRQLFSAALKVLKPGGILIYSTCSLEPEEDEETINWALNRYENIKLMELPSIGSSGITSYNGQQMNPELSRCIRMWPHKTETDGFFLCCIKKE